MYPINKGYITIDGKSEQLNKYISVIPQHGLILKGTVDDNLGLNRSNYELYSDLSKSKEKHIDNLDYHS